VGAGGGGEGGEVFEGDVSGAQTSFECVKVFLFLFLFLENVGDVKRTCNFLHYYND
jgi:hypothetical protein